MNGIKRATLLAASVLALTATAASAEVVCNDDGDCWHTRGNYDFRPEFRLQIHPDGWRWSDNDGHRFRWREHDGRGYWRNGVWLDF